MIEIDLRIGSDHWRDIHHISDLCADVCAVIDAHGQVDLLLADDETIRQLNRDWRGKDRPTDVLSFPADADSPGDFLGDIAISHGVASREARASKKTFEAHFCHLLIHGLLHLLGHDHEDEVQADIMEARERAALAMLGIADPYRPSTRANV